MLQKFKDSVVEEIEKRIRNPFMGAFLISWLFWNWKILYVLFFIDEKYVSIEPVAANTIVFFTKFEYISNLHIFNIYDSLINPLWSSFLLVFFVEWFTTGAILFINHIKNYILGYERLTKEASSELKNILKVDRNKYLEAQSLNNEEILALQNKIAQYEASMDQKVDERLRIIQDKNLKRIKELEADLEKSEVVSSERLEKNIVLEQINKTQEFIIQNNELYTNSGKDSNLVNEEYLSDYEEFKKSFFFEKFDQFIEIIEASPYNLLRNFSGKDIKYLELKGIIEKEEDREGDAFYKFTKKGDRFVGFFLDNYKGSTDNPVKGNIEDIPF